MQDPDCFRGCTPRATSRPPRGSANGPTLRGAGGELEPLEPAALPVQVVTRRELEREARDASIALRELEAIAVEARERGRSLTDEHADGMARVRELLRSKLRELQR